MPEKIKKDAVYIRLREDIIATMLAGNAKRGSFSENYPASHSDMAACVDALVRMFEIKRRPLAADLVDEQFYDPNTLRDARDPSPTSGYTPGRLPGHIGDPDPVGGGLVGDHGSPNEIGDLRTPMERERDEREATNLLKRFADEQHEAIAVEQEMRNAEGESVHSYTPRPAKGRYA